jgi:bifunctional non-homologous end joining protein LigD
MELEGIVCKRADRPYRSGRTGDWLKVKCRNHQELVIGGFTEPGGGRSGFGALLVGAHEHGGGLRYCGRVGTGFSGKSLRELRERLRAIERRSSPFVNPPRGAAARGVHWVEPELVCQVEFAGWTQDRMLRAPSFKGLREDKPAAEVRIEAAVDAPPMPSAAGAKKERRVREPKAPVPAAGRKARDAVDIAGVRLTHPDRVLYPEQGITKHALALYYLAVAERILPYVARRPVTLLRCPEGHEKECFVQRHANALFPESVPRFELEEKGKKVVYPYVDSARSLIGLVQLGVLEIHPWGSRIDDLERPDRILFDLDPDVGLPLERVTQAAVDVRERLQSLGLSSFVKTTGGKGLHVVVPIAPRHGWDVVKEFCAAVARAIARDAPDRYVVTAVKAKRTGKLFIDYLRNTRSATAVAAYSTRARARAPVSVPLRWEELAEGVRPDQYTIENLPRRLSALRRDPWADYDRVEQSIESAVKRLSRT